MDISETQTGFLLVIFTTIESSHVLARQATINEWRQLIDSESSRGGQALMFKSCIAALRDHISSSYDSVPAEDKGNIMYLFFLLWANFVMAEDNASALK